ncbi:hypothetical protein H6503_02065 [Candidatus Woesearchaeota archaeon]|nr:hypothetical protein [Candidatus Woesearchaeota archaeon]
MYDKLPHYNPSRGEFFAVLGHEIETGMERVFTNCLYIRNERIAKEDWYVLIGQNTEVYSLDRGAISRIRVPVNGSEVTPGQIKSERIVTKVLCDMGNRPESVRDFIREASMLTPGLEGFIKRIQEQTR